MEATSLTSEQTNAFSYIFSVPTKTESRSYETQTRMYGRNGVAFKLSAQFDLIFDSPTSGFTGRMNVDAERADLMADDPFFEDVIGFLMMSSQILLYSVKTNQPNENIISMPTKTDSRSSATQRRMYGPDGAVSKMLTKNAVTEYMDSTYGSGFDSVIEHISCRPRDA